MVLSALLGTHPPHLPVRTVIRITALFGITEGTTRVALSRLAADGDVVADAGHYGLSPRLIERQAEQDRAIHPRTRPWRGRWEVAVAGTEAAGADRAALGQAMARLRLAELRPGVWSRPDNLIRSWPTDVPAPVWRFGAYGPPTRATDQSARLARALWDLPGWATTARDLVAALADARLPADRFVLAAATVRHLRRDPVLPDALLPPDWPGGDLRRVYDAYTVELADLVEGAGATRARHRAL